MIKKTYGDYYPQQSTLYMSAKEISEQQTFNLDDYMELVSNEQLEAKYSVHLEKNGENVLTM